ncbi:NADH:flavin oxidoreductase/NADH oxidase [Paralcaligenes ureilyticus]|uniref:2,4-dienoyl-CoA reductase-like NADH-dependent reductase (Old Yellow Enzyme family) n=1 Tax=Paralcaligenes ureilyticus TaxID=627131 RepID=A0A4R3MDQ4_9BURK|nr:NADH:flavin oxidoreductase/NADH oxidase [Paralcaligenes ureilyticus]TCT09665.1 2,4-dienoyl-CoA reductase-like NADH-dependent reductase (Old Yellow Enzyme family) [Paralcaligenes ureilyticus]
MTDTRKDVPLFTPIKSRGVTAKNRIVISPMQQYSAGNDGKPTSWHLSHLEKLAIGGAGIVFTEALAIEEQGRATHADLGIWNDAQVEALKPIAEAISRHGALAGAQLIHAGRKASVQVPWDGYQSLNAENAARGLAPWPTVAPSAIPANPGWQVPKALTIDEIRRLRDAYGIAARRAAQAGFQALNVHGAHGYLIHSFLSPLANHRTDEYGGDIQGRMRFPLEVAEAVRAEWPSNLPIFYRLSCIDDLDGGWTLDDTVVLSRELGARGIDVIDCSSRGLAERGTLSPGREPGFQVPFAERVRKDTGLSTMAVGLITKADFANDIVASDRADYVAIGRESLINPHWPLHAAVELGFDPDYQTWPQPYGWWLLRRDRAAARGR